MRVGGLSFSSPFPAPRLKQISEARKSEICSPTRVYDPRLFANILFARRFTSFACSQIRDLLAASLRLLVRKSEICSPTRIYDPRLFANILFALRLGSTTLACSQTFCLLSDSGLRPSLVRKHSVCSPLHFVRLKSTVSLMPSSMEYFGA